MPEQTPNHDWTIPTPGGDRDVWGEILNTVFQILDRDTILKGTLGSRPIAGQEGRWYLAVDQSPPSIYYDTGASWQNVLTSDTYLRTSGGTVTGTTRFTGTTRVDTDLESRITLTGSNGSGILNVTGNTIRQAPRFRYTGNVSVDDLGGLSLVNYNTAGDGWYDLDERLLTGLDLQVRDGLNGLKTAVSFDYTGQAVFPYPVAMDGTLTVLGDITTNGNEVYHAGNPPPSSGGGGTGSSFMPTYHIDDYGADPTGATPSDTALNNAVAAASEGDRIAITGGTYRFDTQHIFNKSLIIDGSGSEIVTTYSASYTDQLEPCFAFHGTQTHEVDLVADVQRGDTTISVPDASIFSPNDGVRIRDSGYLARGYKPTRDIVTSVDTTADTITLRKGAQYSYSAADVAAVVGRIDPVEKPVFRNMTISGSASNIPVETRFTRDALYENVAVQGFIRHAFVIWSDLGTKLRDCEAANPVSFDASHGEAMYLVGGTDVSIDHPTIRGTRRGIDIRSGTQNVQVNEPTISDVTLHGISFHNQDIDHVRGSLFVKGGTISTRQTDASLAVQLGNGFNTSNLATEMKFVGTTFRCRRNAGDIYGANVTLIGCRFEPAEDVSELIAIHSGARNITISDCRWDTGDHAVTRGVYCYGPTDPPADISISGDFTGTYTQTPVRLDHVQDISVDADIDATMAYAYYLPVAGDPQNVTIDGNIEGSATSEGILLEAGHDIDIDVSHTAAATATVRGIRIYDADNVRVSGYYETPGRGIIISGSPNGVTIENATVAANGGTQAIGSGLLAAGAAPSGVKVMNCDVSKGTNAAITFESAVDGLWIGHNRCGVVTPNASSVVIYNAGNGGV